MRVGVIGAGIAGIGVALELAARGVAVDLHEKRQEVHAAASLANEGKIHLGYIYSNDSTLRTARLMVEGSWHFSSIVGEWLGRELDESFWSSRTYFLIHRNSLLGPSELDAAFAKIGELNREASQRPGASYFGLPAGRAPRRLSNSERDASFGPDVVAAYETEEVSVDSSAIGEVLARRVANESGITLRLGSTVREAVPDATGVTIRHRIDGHDQTIRYDHVVNASWCDLLRIDATAGLPAVADASFRWRHVVRIPAPHGAGPLPTVSVVLGAYGDLVEYGRGHLFLSWYPAGRRAMSVSPTPPAEWQEGRLDGDPGEVIEPTLAAMRALVPALEALPARSISEAFVQGGVVYARGGTDIDRPSSRLHRRDDIGVRTEGRYHSFDPGKYTTAPLFARRLAEAITRGRRR